MAYFICINVMFYLTKAILQRILLGYTYLTHITNEQQQQSMHSDDSIATPTQQGTFRTEKQVQLNINKVNTAVWGWQVYYLCSIYLGCKHVNALCFYWSTTSTFMHVSLIVDAPWTWSSVATLHYDNNRNSWANICLWQTQTCKRQQIKSHYIQKDTMCTLKHIHIICYKREPLIKSIEEALHGEWMAF